MTAFDRWRRRRLLVAVLALEAVLASLPAAAQEGRRLRRIPVPQPQETAARYEGGLPLPTRADCEAAARQIAAAYGPRTLRAYLAERFPYREELLVGLDRVGLQATRILLEVESVESVQVGPWLVRGEAERAGRTALSSECRVDLRTRLAFEDVTSGRRVVRPAGRAEWRIELRAEVEP